MSSDTTAVTPDVGDQAEAQTDAEELDRKAIAAAAESLRGNGHYVDDDDLAEAFEAASKVYDTAEAAEVDRLMRETLFGGMDVQGDGVRIRIKHAADYAASMVAAFDELINQRGCENYIEWESTLTDPDPGKWRRYTFIVVKPGGQTPHQLRREAEAQRDLLGQALFSAFMSGSWRAVTGMMAGPERNAAADAVEAFAKRASVSPPIDLAELRWWKQPWQGK